MGQTEAMKAQHLTLQVRNGRGGCRVSQKGQDVCAKRDGHSPNQSQGSCLETQPQPQAGPMPDGKQLPSPNWFLKPSSRLVAPCGPEARRPENSPPVSPEAGHPAFSGRRFTACFPAQRALASCPRSKLRMADPFSRTRGLERSAPGRPSWDASAVPRDPDAPGNWAAGRTPSGTRRAPGGDRSGLPFLLGPTGRAEAPGSA